MYTGIENYRKSGSDLFLKALKIDIWYKDALTALNFNLIDNN